MPLAKIKLEPPPTPVTPVVRTPPTPVTPVPPVTPMTIAPAPSTSSHLVTALSTPQPTILSTSAVKMTNSRILTPATLSDLAGYDMMDLPIDFDETPTVDLDDVK